MHALRFNIILREPAKESSEDYDADAAEIGRMTTADAPHAEALLTSAHMMAKAKGYKVVVELECDNCEQVVVDGQGAIEVARILAVSAPAKA